jgi:hypothetical protein
LKSFDKSILMKKKMNVVDPIGISKNFGAIGRGAKQSE